MLEAYDIGQVVYVVSPKSQQVIPVQVVERIVKSTVNGDEIIYKVMGPKGEGPHDLNKVDGDFYTDPDAVLRDLQAKVIAMVNKMVSNAINVAASRFKTPSPKQDGSLTLKLPKTERPINGKPAMVTKPKPTDDLFPMKEGEIELPPGPDGKPRIARVRSVTS